MTVDYATDTDEVDDGMKTPTGEPLADGNVQQTPVPTTAEGGVMAEPVVLEPEVRSHCNDRFFVSEAHETPFFF